MKTDRPQGLVNRISLLLKVAAILPNPILASGGSFLTSLNLLPSDLQAGFQGLFVGRAGKARAAFFKMIAKWISDAKNASKNGKKVFLVPFNFPVEIIYAFDKAVPLTSEVLTTLGVIALEGQGEQYWDMAMGLGLPDHICSANAVELGSMLGSEDFRPHAIISSALGGCDANSKLHEFVANYLEIPHLFLQKPPDDTGRGRKQYGVYLRNLIAQLEEFLDEKLQEDKLRRVMEKANRCTELYNELLDLRKAVPCPVPNVFSLFTYGTRFTTWGTDEAIRTLQSMVDVSKQRLAKKAYPAEKENARCIWVYLSYYYDLAGYFNWMEERGYSHLGDALMLCFPQMINTSSTETMLEGYADTAWGMPMTRQMGAESMSRAWTEDIVWAARELKADCAIFCGHHSCKQTWSVISILQRELMDQVGIPLLVLQGDSWIKRMTPMSAIQQEIDAFVKNVVSRKSSPRRKLKKGRRKQVDNQTDPKDALFSRSKD